MAISVEYLKENLKKLSTEELETKYEELKKGLTFGSKEQFLEHKIEKVLEVNIDKYDLKTVKVIEEILKERTGNDYNFEPISYEVTLDDIISYICSVDSFWKDAMSNFISKVDASDDEKERFFLYLYQDKESFNEFSKELLKTENIDELFKKYNDIALRYVGSHSYK